jgi:hypothetical protein
MLPEKRKNAEIKMREVGCHVLETITGQFVVIGEMNEETEKAVAMLSKDDDLWLKLYDAGINEVRMWV